MRVCHFSSVHRDGDIRIYHKECGSLAARGYEVHLVISAERDYRGANGVQVHALSPLPRLARMTVGAWRAYKKARQLDADIYHFHDPELLGFGYLLAQAGKTVIYDVHEDVPADILSKEWIPRRLRRAVATAYKWIETLVCKRLAAVVAATPHIALRYSSQGIDVRTVNNYPFKTEFANRSERRWMQQICYVGGIDEIRGVSQMVESAGLAAVPLTLAGRFSSESLFDRMRQSPAWQCVSYKGAVTREEVGHILSEASIGLVLFHPLPNHLNAQPNKLFEYMSAGLPVLASDFPLWRDIVLRSDCGLCVDPLSADAIAQAIGELLGDRQRLERMGRNGRDAVEQVYNWEAEQGSLLRLYDDLAESMNA
ncbi:glycosyltransferase family 4 protein [Pseudomonas sp. TE50-2]|uniref:glycosyltransferase family 4 protein n=1 Tax=Pseudomonas sp. TE50-2 TaxID=3142707 RepID=UPI003466B2AD